MEHSGAPETLAPHQVIAERVRDLRKGRGWSAERLAEEMAAVGIPWTRAVVTKLETKRRPGVSIEEVFALAYVLSVAPIHLMVPPLDAEDLTPYRITPEGPNTVPSFARAWIRGHSPIGEVDAKRYFAEVPDSEWKPPADQWTPENIERQSAAVRPIRPDRREGDDGER